MSDPDSSEVWHTGIPGLFSLCSRKDLTKFKEAYDKVINKRLRIGVTKEEVNDYIRDLKIDDKTLLTSAIFSGKIENFYFLLDQGVKINFSKDAGYNIFEAVLKSSCSTELLMRLIETLTSKTDNAGFFLDGVKKLLTEERIDILEYVIDRLRNTPDYDEFLSQVFLEASKVIKIRVLECLAKYYPYH